MHLSKPKSEISILELSYPERGRRFSKFLLKNTHLLTTFPQFHSENTKTYFLLKKKIKQNTSIKSYLQTLFETTNLHIGSY